ncbi:rust resistance kinase Lr10-like [Pistacia vera]|uniref:rust resistance kinase Lr10-like n=1 Tax=Pistacia vera TaxID=55513 RepID=UPI001263BF65|nr:rust resistance kinase Lr10-like [Pistacia vera]
MEWKALAGCYHCEKSRNYCGFNTTSNSTICVKQKHFQGNGLILGIIGGILFLAFAFVVILIYKYRKSRNEKQTQLKVEKFLRDYKAVNPTRYTFRDLKKITSKFKYRLGQRGFGSVFKGKLSNGIPVAVKMLKHSKTNGEEFINEVATIGRIHHFNIVHLLGFFSEGARHALIYEFMPNGSLEKLIFSKINNSNHRLLSWEKMLNIAIGVAHGIEYLHQGCDQRILHFDIKPHNILLDHNFQPKISDFGLAKLCSKEKSIISVTTARGTTGYIAPELFSRHFGEVSYKSDVFSFGMMLLEMVGCRENFDFNIENASQVYFPEWIYNTMSHGEELCLEIEEGGDEEIAKKLAIVALWCIQWNPTERPSMPMVIQMLEGDLQSLEIPPKPFVSSEDEMDAN